MEKTVNEVKKLFRQIVQKIENVNGKRTICFIKISPVFNFIQTRKVQKILYISLLKALLKKKVARRLTIYFVQNS